MFAAVESATLAGVDGRPVTVEVHVTNGMPTFSIVGLPDASCRESRDRVRSAFASSQLRWPKTRITVNLAPSGFSKVGAGLDLAIAVGLLAADGQLLPDAVAGMAFIGELGLDGTLRRVEGTVSLTSAVRRRSAAVVVGRDAAAEAALVGGVTVRPAVTLRQVVAALAGTEGWSPLPPASAPVAADGGGDLADVRGQALGRRALEVAAAGGHHLMLVGPPGAGKTMLARRLPGLLPPLDDAEAVEVTRIHSAAGVTLPPSVLVRRPPFRAPHHTASTVSLVGGGGSTMRPGEISCAHRGVLFLDEMGEFPADVLDALRQPLEEGQVLVCRARAAVTMPARFLLVGATNPCPCGGPGSPGGCRCSPSALARYAARLTGPLVDRFDLRVQVERPDVTELLAQQPVAAAESTAVVAARVAAARAAASARGVTANAHLPASRLDELAPLDRAASAMLETRLRQGQLSARGLHRVRRVARTLADLGGDVGQLRLEHVAEALLLRCDPFAGHAAATAEGALR